MFNPRYAALLPLLLAAAACDDGGSSARDVPKTKIAEKNPYHESMLALDANNRMLTLRRAVQDEGNSCRTVTASAYQQQYEGMAMWIAYCSSGAWAVYIAPSGIVQVRACKDARQLGLPECLPEPRDPDEVPMWPREAPPPPPPPLTPPPVAR
jgi:hypothetical protein